MALILRHENAEISITRLKRRYGISQGFFSPIDSCDHESDESLIAACRIPVYYWRAACVNLMAQPTPAVVLQLGRPGPVPVELAVRVK